MSFDYAGDGALLRALADPGMYPGHPQVVVHETHASWVFVAGDRAYKVKKPVSLGFLDYSTLARRRGACVEEVRVNGALAPDLYLGVRGIVKSGTGFRLARDGAPNALEYAVEMRSFRDQDTLAGLIAAGALTRAHVGRVARLLAEFHGSAEVSHHSTADPMRCVWGRNVEELRGLDHPAKWDLDVVGAFGETFLTRHAAEMRRRALLGLIRDGHGDLRCEHVLVRPEVRIVDRIEFDPRLRRIDVACDLAFLAMDLEAHGQPWAANELCRAYAGAGMSPGGKALRSFYAAHWALVRAKVALIAAAEHAGGTSTWHMQQAEQLWSLAERLGWRARSPLAVVICGPPASGKSVLAAELSHRSEMPIVSSDAVRKALARVEPTEPASVEHYSAGFSRATYVQLGRDALLALRRGNGVIVDATCHSREHRALLLGRLGQAGTRRLVVRCELPVELAVQRAKQRLCDPKRVSDATPQIAEELFHRFEELDELPPDTVLRLDTSRPLETQIAEVALAVDQLARRGGPAGRSGSPESEPVREQPWELPSR
jgi:aminoglycoside phosphotransferase family enzyme/predicted kinase